MTLVSAGFATAAVAYLALLAFLVLGRRFTWPFNYLIVFALMSAVWALGLWFSVGRDFGFGALILIESLQATGALMFLGQLIGRGGKTGWRRVFLLLPWTILPIGGGVYWWSQTSGSVGFESAYYFILLTSLAGLLAAEQIIRNPGLVKRGVAALVAVAFGALFVFDLYTYSNAIVLSGLSAGLWGARGFVSALIVPLIVVAIRREPDWRGNLFVSRQVVFYTASFVAVGGYLLLVAFGSVLIQRLGGEWAAVARTVFLVATLAVLVLAVFSQQLRRRAKVFLATHFYANRYDYREEWLRLIRRLAKDSERAPMPELCLDALADIVDSDGGVLWLPVSDDASRWYVAAHFGERTGAIELPAEHPLPTFMRRKAWVVDGAEAAADPGHYDDAFDTNSDAVVGAQRIFVPIVLDEELSGIAALNRPAGFPDLNFEDHDLLRTVGQQLAVFLQRDRSRELLAEAREFEVFNRFTAFIMHDLKNLIAQQSLVVENAKKHKSNPAFIEDAIATIANSVKRMNGLLAQLQGDAREGGATAVSAEAVAHAAVSAASSRPPAPELAVREDGLLRANADRLSAVLGHLLRNAQDASDKGGLVQLTVDSDETSVSIAIRDEGVGMSESFIRERLFRPFDSTKGAQGMGIGMYQARDYVQSLQGQLNVVSSPGEGTTVSLRFPKHK
ncbi:MAG: XrtA/PEP-CTERM system histidine kinase PrsK [Pseudomonadota bacterium]